MRPLLLLLLLATAALVRASDDTAILQKFYDTQMKGKFLDSVKVLKTSGSGKGDGEVPNADALQASDLSLLAPSEGFSGQYSKEALTKCQIEWAWNQYLDFNTWDAFYTSIFLLAIKEYKCSADDALCKVTLSEAGRPQAQSLFFQEPMERGTTCYDVRLQVMKAVKNNLVKKFGLTATTATKAKLEPLVQKYYDEHVKGKYTPKPWQVGDLAPIPDADVVPAALLASVEDPEHHVLGPHRQCLQGWVDKYMLKSPGVRALYTLMALQALQSERVKLGSGGAAQLAQFKQWAATVPQCAALINGAYTKAITEKLLAAAAASK